MSYESVLIHESCKIFGFIEKQKTYNTISHLSMIKVIRQAKADVIMTIIQNLSTILLQTKLQEL